MRIAMRFAHDSPRGREVEWAGVVQHVDDTTGVMRLYFAEDGETLHGIRPDDPDLRPLTTGRRSVAFSSSDSDSGSGSD